jgi:predicted ester cyclase
MEMRGRHVELRLAGALFALAGPEVFGGPQLPSSGEFMTLSDLARFGEEYARAWCCQNPELVAACYAQNGSLRVNEQPPALGRAAIAEVAHGFMRDFPDMVVRMDKVIAQSPGDEFHWTLSGTNTGPGGTGKRIRISGYEQWRLNSDGLIESSQGHFDSAEYERQIREGIDG